MAESTGSGEQRYKIGDVCRLADVQPYVLRYWESEFPALAPDRSVPGPRTYSERELRLIEQIKRLLYDEGYTIAGAKKRLVGEGGSAAPAKAPPAPAPPPEAKPAKAVKPEPPATPPPEKPRAPRPAKPERKAAEDAPPADGLPVTTAPIAVSREVAPVPADDGRVARAVAELKDVLALLSRETP